MKAVPTHLPAFHPERGARDYWPLLRDAVPSEMVDTASWDRLAPAARALPSPAFLLERTLDSPRLIQFGCHVWPWRMAAALSSAAEFSHAGFLTPHVHALRACRSQEPYLHFMAMWDEAAEDAPLLPQTFLAFSPGHPGWRAAVRAFAERIDAADFRNAWLRSAATPHARAVAIGVYLGRRDLPVRVTVIPGAGREWAGHPNWKAVDEIAGLTAVSPVVAVAPAADPGPTWHVPVIASRHPRPHEALAPLVDALRGRGLADAETARMLTRPPLMIPVPGGGTVDGSPALVRLMVSLERIKVVVEHGEWLSAKACYMVRLVWRTGSGRVLVED
jgi:hypothetical protein